MTQQQSLGIRVLISAILLGLAGDLLIRDFDWGIGFAIWSWLIAGGLAYLIRFKTFAISKQILALIPITILFSTSFGWRDAMELKGLNFLCLFLTVGIIGLRSRSGNIFRATIFDYTLRIIERWLIFLGDFVHLIQLDGQWKEVRKVQHGEEYASIGKGILITIPILLIFGSLFVNSDAVYRHYVNKVFDFDASSLMSHLLVMSCCSWLLGGFFRRVFFNPEDPLTPLGPPKPHPVGNIEVSIVLGSLNLLFASFIIVQFRTLFGGDKFVQVTAHLSYGEYARQGFFELVIASLLGLTILTGSRGFISIWISSQWTRYKQFALCLITSIFVVMASAVYRLALYVQAYGFTVDRFYALASLIWLGMVLTWFMVCTLRKLQDQFAFGAFVSLLVVVLGLNIVNPDSMIARINLARPAAKIDSKYLTGLSLDATPTLIEGIRTMPKERQSEMINVFKSQHSDLIYRDWRTWNLSVGAAREALERNGL